jgi:hypothetical protein
VNSLFGRAADVILGDDDRGFRRRHFSFAFDEVVEYNSSPEELKGWIRVLRVASGMG